MQDISNFEISDRYTLYDVVIMKSKKTKGLFYAKKKYVSLKEIEDQRFHSLNEEIINGKPITTGYFYIYDNNVDNIEDFNPDSYSQKYELVIVRDTKGNKIIEKGIKVSSKKEIMLLTISPIRKTKEAKKDYFFLNVSIKEEDFDRAKNKEDIIEGFRKKGLDFQAEPRQGFYQFNTLVFPSPKQIPTINSYAGKTMHLEVFVKEKEDTFNLQRVGRGVFELGSLSIDGMVSNVDGDKVEITMYTNWDELSENNNRNIIHFTSEPREDLKEPTPEGNTIKLKFLVKSTTEYSGDIGDDIKFELNEDNVKKILNTKIVVDLNKKEVEKEKEEIVVSEKDADTAIVKDENLPF